MLLAPTTDDNHPSITAVCRQDHDQFKQEEATSLEWSETAMAPIIKIALIQLHPKVSPTPAPTSVV